MNTIPTSVFHLFRLRDSWGVDKLGLTNDAKPDRRAGNMAFSERCHVLRSFLLVRAVNCSQQYLRGSDEELVVVLEVRRTNSHRFADSGVFSL